MLKFGQAYGGASGGLSESSLLDILAAELSVEVLSSELFNSVLSESEPDKLSPELTGVLSNSMSDGCEELSELEDGR
jgi:hypothetical protein